MDTSNPLYSQPNFGLARMKFLLVGLGNIGAEYKDTRHNIGFSIVDYIAQKENLTFQSERYADAALWKWRGKQVHLIKPTTYMNLSGKAVHFWLEKTRVTPNRMLVLVDDLALPFGQLRLRPGGSSAGHNGLRNIEELLKSQQYPRLRVGIGNDFPKGKQADFVLSNFAESEQAQLPDLLEKAHQAIQLFMLEGIQAAMNKMNTKEKME